MSKRLVLFRRYVGFPVVNGTGSGVDRSNVSEGNIRDLVVQLLTECNPGCLPPTRMENNRTKLKLQVSRPKVFDRRSW
ncbi:hypothetical protein FHG87_016655 [Trinorchestia longiramus]|nr:hypothetical protein FHG87_016655 [Trinorchestia longiramus]